MSEPWVWDQYWHGDRVALCFDAQQNQYEEDIAGGWRDWFGEQSVGATLLDLCTGNGALPLLALEASDQSNKAFEITGVDFAAIDPATWLASRSQDVARITFKGGVDICALPFEDEAFDAITSQYGIEYSDLSRSLPEAARALKSGGKLRFLLHAMEGTVASGASAEVSRIDTFLGSTSIFESARRALKARTKLREKKVPSTRLLERARVTETRFREAASKAQAASSQASDDFVRHTVTLLMTTLQAADTQPSDQLMTQIKATEEAILAHRGRLEALVRAAVDEDHASEVATTLERLDVACGPPTPLTTLNGRQIGWLLEGQKHSAHK